MAISSIDQIQQAYIAYYGRPADPNGLTYWANQLDKAGGNLSVIINAFGNSAESTALYGGSSLAAQVNKVYNTLFGRDADSAGLNFYVQGIQNGQFTLASVALNVFNGAQGTDKTGLESKLAYAKAFTAAIDTTQEIVGYSGDNAANAARAALAPVKDAASLGAATANLDTAVGSVTGQGTPGQTFTLTKGLDVIAGTAGNDTIIGSVDSTLATELNTLSALDSIDGGAGKDTLKISSADGTAINLGAIKNIEVVEAQSAAALNVDASAADGVATLNVTKAVGNATAKAAATTDVSVTLDATTSNAVAVTGGKNVNVELTKAAAAADTVTIGTEALGVVSNAAKGDVTVSVTGKAYDAAANADVTLGAIKVNGGKTITVTQKATSDAAGAAADKTANKVVQGAVTVTTDASTTTVTVKQDAAVAAKNAVDTTGGVTETASVKFGALKSGDVLSANGLTFTAKADMTAAEVAAAFANLVNGSLPVSGDTQSSGLATKGIYTGAFATSAAVANTWTSAAANGDTVVFTATRANTDATNLSFTLTNTSGNSVAPVVTTAEGKAHNATPTGGVMGVDAGAVVIAGVDAAALKTVNVDGYSATGSAITAASTALETLNLSNGGDFAVAQAAETFSLNLKNVGTAAKAETLTSAAALEARAVLDLNNTATKTLNVKSDGANTVSLDLAGATGTTALNVSGTGLLDAKTASNLGNVATIKVTEAAGLNLGTTATTNVTSVDTTGTTGAVTIAIDGGKATYAGGAGKDSVTINAVTGVFNKAINLGAGDDTLNLSLTDVQLKAIPTTNVLEGGEGIDTLVLTAANAVELSKDAVFAGKINGFEKLSIGNAAAAGTVNLANLDNINYVVSANSASVAAAATKEVFTIDFATSGTIVGADTITFDGLTITLAGGESPAQIAAAFAAKSSTNWDVTVVSGSVVTFTAKTAGVTTDVVVGNFTFNDVGSEGTTAAGVVTTTNQGAAAGAAAPALTIDKLASGGTLELTDIGAGAIVNVTNAGTGTADVLNVVANAAGSLGTVKAAEVETINLSVANKATTFTPVYGNVKVADVSTSSLALDANAATKIAVTGAGNLTLDLAAANKVATVDASAATGALSLDLSAHNGVAMTVNGGAGNDVLKASAGINAKADVLAGGAGNDTLWMGSNGAKLTGGAGNDLFVLQAGNKEANTFSSITDFSAGDVLQLKTVDIAAAVTNVASFAKLTANLNESTSVFANFADAAAAQATNGQAVWFSFKGDSYVVVDNGLDSATFQNGVDAVVQLVGVDLTSASFNAQHGTIALA